MAKFLYGAAVQGIQVFIFQTNKLREIVGASELVKEICESLFEETVGGKYREYENEEGGGSILHANIDAPFNSFEKAWDMVNYISDAGVTYFAFNTKIQACDNNHAFYGHQCPVCGRPVETEYTRIVGFYTPIKTWSKERTGEYKMRKWEPVNK
jgi:anaerobic ribonucleoside-triphosphate reductase